MYLYTSWIILKHLHAHVLSSSRSNNDAIQNMYAWKARTVITFVCMNIKYACQNDANGMITMGNGIRM